MCDVFLGVQEVVLKTELLSSRSFSIIVVNNRQHSFTQVNEIVSGCGKCNTKLGKNVGVSLGIAGG